MSVPDNIRPKVVEDIEKAFWDYEWHVDPNTGDAWRLVKRETGYFGGRWWEDDDFRITPFFGESR